MTDLVLILGDQLTPAISALQDRDPKDTRILMAEVMGEATYVRHHKKKIAFLFSAMRHFAEALRQEGWQVDYFALDDEENSGSLAGELSRAVQRHAPERIFVTEPGEYRVREDLLNWRDDADAPLELLPDDRWLCPTDEFESWAEGRKQLRMEYFYREMRRKTGLLMEGDDPVGGKWNLDAQNRKPAERDLFMPKPPRFEPDEITQEVLALVGERFDDHFGTLEPFRFGVTAAEAGEALDHFVEHALPSFGDYQDAMLEGESFLYHSVLSPYINCGLLDPMTVCRRVERAYLDGDAPLNAAEGYIRQIIGWREYVRGIYWLKMPSYVEENFFDNSRPLPWFYWTGETKMACMRAAICQTRDEAYAHHIQRLMVTGNFALLAGIAPREVHEWYLAVYADAYEWVELPNTLGMSQFADGGLLGSKPYASSGNYISKMSDYCKGCSYSVSKKTGDGACPFNPLYWHFLHRNRAKLDQNPRMAQMYSTWDRMSEEKRAEYLESAKKVLDDLENA